MTESSSLPASSAATPPATPARAESLPEKPLVADDALPIPASIPSPICLPSLSPTAEAFTEESSPMSLDPNPFMLGKMLRYALPTLLAT